LSIALSRKYLFFVFSLFVLINGLTAQNAMVGKKQTMIAFWNVENLYDTLNDKFKNDDDFTPGGIYRWTGKRYWQKIDHLAEVISQMGLSHGLKGPALIGLCEIENKSVLQDLMNASQLKSLRYQMIHIEGPDARGVDPALFYNPEIFKVKKALGYRVTLVTDTGHKTRDILVVSGSFDGEPLAVLVNHWPSRRGGELQSRPNRNGAARIARRIADSIVAVDPRCRIVIMGDLNDDPVNESVRKHIGTYADRNNKVAGKFFNPAEELYKNGIGTLAWQDSWNLFDQLILNDPWIDGMKGWKFNAAMIFNKPFLKTDHGNFKGYPFRTFSGGSYTGGYSDHFPSYIIIEKRE
jgi:hypothetical protein